MKYIVIIILSVFFVNQAQSQINIGFLTGYDLYQRYVNPEDASGLDRSSGSVILNTSIGAKIWLSTKVVGISVESYGNIGLLALNVEEFKGLGAFSLPVIGKLNFKGLTGVNKIKSFGYYIGGGVQWNKTELYGLSSDAKTKGVVRDFYKTYVIELGLGSGSREKSTEFFVRYGFNGGSPSSNLHIGVNTSYSLVHRGWAKLRKPPSVQEEEDVIKM